MSKKLLKAHQGTIVYKDQQASPMPPTPMERPDPSINVKPYGQVPDFMQPEQAEQVIPTTGSPTPRFDPNNPAPNEMAVANPTTQVQQTLQDLLNDRKGQQMQQALNDPNLPEQFKEDLQNKVDRFNFDMRQKQFFGNDREKQRAFGEYQQLNQNEMGMRQGQEAIQNLFKDSNQQYEDEVAAIKEKYNTMGGNPAQNFLMRQKGLMDAMGKRYRRRKEIEQGDTFKNLNRNLEDLQFEDAKRMFDDFSSNYKAVGKGQSVARPMQFNEGGTVMEKQMEMNFGEKPNTTSGTFLFDEGGMKDDGGEKDPVSGNDVPSGSLAEEVRDDVPAMVSEGEFIFPADVTRFIGLNKLMELRQDAKMGLKKMEAMGQLGNPEDAELPDDIPFDAADIIIIDDEMEADEKEMEVDKKNKGGVFGYQKGTGNPAGLTILDPDKLEQIKQEQAKQQDNKYYNIQEEGMKQYARRYVIYRNDAGQTIKVLSTANGSPIDTVPAGYKMVIDENGLPATELPDSMKEEEKKPEIEQPTVQQKDDNDREPETFYSGEYLADKFKGDVIYDANGNPRTMTEAGYNAVLTSARRLGLDANTYFNLPMGAKMDMLGQEFAGLFGKEVDQDYVNNIVKQVQAGEYKSKGLFGLLGGFGDWISNLFGNGTPEETQKIINNVNDSKPTKPTKSEPPKFTGSVGDALRSQQDRQEKFAKQRRSNESKRTRIAASKNQSDRSQVQVDPTASREDRITQAKAKSTVKNFKGVRDSSGRKKKLSGKQMKAGVDVGSGVGGSNLSGPFKKGTLVTKRETKKPTKGKTLVTKRS